MVLTRLGLALVKDDTPASGDLDHRTANLQLSEVLSPNRDEG
jgi:hypothetical protein